MAWFWRGCWWRYSNKEVDGESVKYLKLKQHRLLLPCFRWDRSLISSSQVDPLLSHVLCLGCSFGYFIKLHWKLKSDKHKKRQLNRRFSILKLQHLQFLRENWFCCHMSQPRVATSTLLHVRSPFWKTILYKTPEGIFEAFESFSNEYI